MTQAKRAAPKKGAAARSERKGKRTVDFHGLKLRLPAELPLAFAFDLVEIEAAEDEAAAVPILRLLRSVLGQEQFTQVRNKIDAQEKADVDLFTELVESVFSAFGVEPGESRGSAKS